MKGSHSSITPSIQRRTSWSVNASMPRISQNAMLVRLSGNPFAVTQKIRSAK